MSQGEASRPRWSVGVVLAVGLGALPGWADGGAREGPGCQVAEPLRRQVDLLFQAVVTHVIDDQTCVDGPQTMAALGEVQVCEKPGADPRVKVLQLHYTLEVDSRPAVDWRRARLERAQRARLERQAHPDARVGPEPELPASPPEPPRPPPVVRTAEVTFQLTPAGWLLQVPERLAGMETFPRASSLREPHRISCGHDQPFPPLQPGPVVLPGQR